VICDYMATGRIPPSIFGLAHMETLALWGNSLFGTVAEHAASSLTMDPTTQAKSLLKLADASTSGTFLLRSTNSKVHKIRARSKPKISQQPAGQIPDSLGSLKNLENGWFQKNAFVGVFELSLSPFPVELTKLCTFRCRSWVFSELQQFV
jgi:hypothetical protein